MMMKMLVELCSFVLLIGPVIASGSCTMMGQRKLDMIRPLIANWTDPAPQTNQTRQLLREQCHFLQESSICCTVDQINSLNQQLRLLSQIVGRCPSCARNLKQLFCHLTCSPNQSQFLRTSPIEDYPEFLETANVYLNSRYAQTLFDSCRNVLHSQTGARAMDILCNTKSDCSPQAMFDYIGHGSRTTSFDLYFVLVNDDQSINATTNRPIRPFPSDPKTKAYQCSEAVSETESACSCTDCIQSCDQPLGGQNTTTTTNFLNTRNITLLYLACLTLCFLVFGFLKFQQKRTKFYDCNRFGQLNAETPIRWMARICTNHPLAIILANAVLIGVMSSGICMYKVTTDPLKLWSAPQSHHRIVKERVFDPKFGPFHRISQIIVSRTDKSRPLLSEELVDFVRNLTWSLETSADLDAVCLRPLRNRSCLIYSLTNYVSPNHHPKSAAVDQIKKCLESPISADCLAPFGGPQPASMVLGGGRNTSSSPTSTMITLVLSGRESERHRVLRWEKNFIAKMNSVKTGEFKVSYMSDRSIEDEIERISRSDALPVGLSYLIMFVYVAIAIPAPKSETHKKCFYKIGLAVVGIGCVVASLAASVGALAYARMPTCLIVFEAVPFLVLAIGVDNIFIIAESVNRNINQQLVVENVLTEVVPGITITSTAEILTFTIASFLINVPAVGMFSLYGALALLFDVALQLTVFICVIAIFAKIINKQPADRQHQQPNKKQLMMEWYSRVLLGNSRPSKILRFSLLAIFILWTYLSAVALQSIKVGFDVKLSVPSNSYVQTYLADMERELRVGPPIYWIVERTSDSVELDFSNMTLRRSICGSWQCNPNSLSNQLSLASMNPSTYLSSSPSSWVDDYMAWLANPSCFRESRLDSINDGTGVDMSHIRTFLSSDPDQKCTLNGRPLHGKAVRFVNETSHLIDSFYLLGYHSPLSNSSQFIEALKVTTRFCEEFSAKVGRSLGFRLVAYSPVYAFYEQYLTIWHTALVSVTVAVITVFVVCLIGFASFYMASLIVLMMGMIIVDVGGMMYLINIELNAISLVNVVMCLGISVEFCVHMIRAFQTQQSSARNALIHAGSSILFGITLTKIGGIAILYFSKSQILQVFYFRMFIIIICTCSAHGLVLLPTLLKFMEPPNRDDGDKPTANVDDAATIGIQTKTRNDDEAIVDTQTPLIKKQEV